MGTGPGLSDIASAFAVGNVASLVTPPAPNGSYYVRVRAGNSAGLGAASAEVRVLVGPPPPSAPALNGSGAAGGIVTLTWSVPASGAAVTGYQLPAGTQVGASNLGVLALPSSATSFNTAGAPAGTYYVRVVATSAQGLGDVSNELTLIVP